MSDFYNIEIIDDITEMYGNGNFNAVRNQVKSAGKKPINFIVNGYGGSVFEAVMIYNYIKGISNSREVRVHIPAYAMSAHTLIASAAPRVSMADNGYYMIHNPWTMTMGDKNDIESTLSLLEGMTDQLADAYVAKTGLQKKRILKMMDAETWLTAQEALDLGFVDELTPGSNFQASFDRQKLEKYTNTPANIFNNNQPDMTEEINTQDEKSFFELVKAFFTGKSDTKPSESAPDPEASVSDTQQNLEADYLALVEKYDALEASAKDLESKLAQALASVDAKDAELALLKTPAAEHTAGPVAVAEQIEDTRPSYLRGDIYDKIAKMQRKTN